MQDAVFYSVNMELSETTKNQNGVIEQVIDYKYIQ